MVVMNQNHRALQYFSHWTHILGSFVISLCCHEKLGVCAGLAKKNLNIAVLTGDSKLPQEMGSLKIIIYSPIESYEMYL